MTDISRLEHEALTLSNFLQKRDTEIKSLRAQNAELLSILTMIANNDLSGKSAAALARSAIATMKMLDRT